MAAKKFKLLENENDSRTLNHVSILLYVGFLEFVCSDNGRIWCASLLHLPTTLIESKN